MFRHVCLPDLLLRHFAMQHMSETALIVEFVCVLFISFNYYMREGIFEWRLVIE